MSLLFAKKTSLVPTLAARQVSPGRRSPALRSGEIEGEITTVSGEGQREGPA